MEQSLIEDFKKAASSLRVNGLTEGNLHKIIREDRAIPCRHCGSPLFFNPNAGDYRAIAASVNCENPSCSGKAVSAAAGK